MNDYKTDYTPYLLQTQTDARGQRIGDYIVPVVTLRDQFAMAALTGIIINETNAANLAAKYAYEYADAMMEARK